MEIARRKTEDPGPTLIDTTGNLRAQRANAAQMKATNAYWSAPTPF